MASAASLQNVTLMIKPVGPLCNLRCHYCYYLPVLEQFEHPRRMSLQTLERVLAGYLPRAASQVTIAWQGGEPTLAGLEFFREAIVLQQRYQRPDQRISHALQTNGTLLDDDWCRFLAEQGFLVGLSLDGPRRMHDHYRVDAAAQPTADQVVQAWHRLQQHGVMTNLLTVLNDRNVHHPEEIFQYLVNLGATHLQFIPAVEWTCDGLHGHGATTAPFSPDPEAYGTFLCRIFDLWFEKHRHRVSVRLFDTMLNRMVVGRAGYCIFESRCAHQLTVEHDGSVFGCDHFVEPRWRLGSAEATAKDPDWPDQLDHQQRQAFSERKTDLGSDCQACPWLSFCHGGCPKHRPGRGDHPQPSVLCAGYKAFFEHAMERLQWLAGFLRAGQLPPPPQPSKGGKKKKKTAPTAQRAGHGYRPR